MGLPLHVKVISGFTWDACIIYFLDITKSPRFTMCLRWEIILYYHLQYVWLDWISCAFNEFQYCWFDLWKQEKNTKYLESYIFKVKYCFSGVLDMLGWTMILLHLAFQSLWSTRNGWFWFNRLSFEFLFRFYWHDK